MADPGCVLLLRTWRDTAQRFAKGRQGRHSCAHLRLKLHALAAPRATPRHFLGTGNHRGSIFRLHVGAALIARGDVEPISTWGQKPSAGRAVRETEVAIERAVSAYIGAMPFLWVSVDDEPGSDSDRGRIEAGAIAALSRVANRATDAPSDTWLGHYAARPAIRQSGLWNVNHVDGSVDGSFLPRLERWVDLTA